jgi:hypothetical protein
MATVLEECNTEEQRSVVRYVWTKGLNTNDIHKKMFSVYSWKSLSRKPVHNLVEKFTQGFSKVTDDETDVWNWLRKQSKTSILRVSTHW